MLGKVAIVTGFSNVISRATAILLASKGIKVNNSGQMYVDATGKEGFEQPVEILQQNLNINLKA